MAEAHAPFRASIARLAVSAAAIGTVGIAQQLLRELRGYRASATLLRERRTAVRVPGLPRLSLFARVAVRAGAALPPIVLVHGYAISGSYFVPLAARLSRAARVFVPDLPGHGSSEGAGHVLDVRELRDVLAAWMHRVGVRDALVVGQSFGCQIAAELAARHPELVRGLMLIAPTIDPHARSVAALLARAVIDAPFERPLLLALAMRDYARAGPHLAASEMAHMIRHDIAPALRTLRARQVPVCVLRGARDTIGTHAWARRVARMAGAPAPVVIPRWAHAVHFGAPNAVARELLWFARRLQRHR